MIFHYDIIFLTRTNHEGQHLSEKADRFEDYEWVGVISTLLGPDAMSVRSFFVSWRHILILLESRRGGI